MTHNNNEKYLDKNGSSVTQELMFLKTVVNRKIMRNWASKRMKTYLAFNFHPLLIELSLCYEKGYFKINVLLINIKSFKQILQVVLLLQFCYLPFIVICAAFTYRNHTITILSDVWNWNTFLSTLQMTWWYKIPLL